MTLTDIVDGSLKRVAVGLKAGKNQRKEPIHRIQLGGYNKSAECNGLRLGAYNGSDTVRGISLGIANMDESTDFALRVGVVNGAAEMEGVDVGLINLAGQDNDRGAQVGFLNAILNFSMFKGAQVGASNIASKLRGLQVGAYADVDHELQGVQLGLFCRGPAEGTYLQLGLLTQRVGGPWYTRFSPLIGFRKTKGAEK